MGAEHVVSPAQYGERINATAVYLNAQQLVPEERVAQVLQDLFDAAAACGASVASWARRKAEALAPVYRAIGERVAAAPVRCLDETGLRIAGATGWLHTESTPTHTFYRADEPRSAVLACEGGVVVHDHWRPYYSLENVDHAFCNAHLLRELQAVCEFDKEPWAETLRATLLDANEAVRNARPIFDSPICEVAEPQRESAPRGRLGTTFRAWEVRRPRRRGRWGAADAGCAQGEAGVGTRSGAGEEAFALVLDLGLGQRIRIGDDVWPGGASAESGDASFQRRFQHQRQEAAEHVTADGLVQFVEDRPGREQGNPPPAAALLAS